MVFVKARGTRLYSESVGEGPAIIFAHEFADNLNSWSGQVSALSRKFKCISYNARGYPPSDVPEEPTLYSQQLAADDINSVLDHYSVSSAHIVGCSMGAFAALHFAIKHPEKALSITMISCGYGAPKHLQKGYAKDSEMLADKYLKLGAEKMAESYADGV